ncbi:RNA polymerase sigma factor [Planktotalea sp.]|uniref:RNA polymerase sigma factor n=1 Tax=Planktotalea sp. TaxID=2029877 RepID=UPI003299B498
MVFKKFFKKSFEASLEEHLPAIWRFALSMSGRPDVADDLLQATCLRALEKQEQFIEGSSLIAWLLTICRSIWLNELRSVAVRKTGSLEPAQLNEIASDASPVEMNIFASEVYTHMMSLPEAQRETCYLVYVQNFSYREAAELLDVPIGTVMSRLATARSKLAPLNDVPSGTRRDNA